MKKSRNLKSLVVAMLVFSMLIIPFQVLAADVSTGIRAKVAVVEQNALAEMEKNVAVAEDAQTMDIQPRTHVSYYPTRGVNSGYFSGTTSDNLAIYSNLPSGTMKFSYSMSGGGTCYLRFYRGEGVDGSPIRSAALNANDYTGISSIYLPVAGPYSVEVYYPNGNANTQIIYAFNLYRD